MKTYAMMILGCKVNDYEATYVRENMNKHFREVDFKSKADIYLILPAALPIQRKQRPGNSSMPQGAPIQTAILLLSAVSARSDQMLKFLMMSI